MTRLPTPGGDTGNWGAILNEYLLTAHSDDGSLKSGIVAGGNIADGAVTTDALADASVTMDKLASSLQTTLSSVVSSAIVGQAGGIASLDSAGKVPASQLPVVDPTTGTPVPDASPTQKGLIQLSGDLGGTATNPTVTKLSGIAISGTPTAGQALVATSPSAAGWSTVSGGGSVPAGAGVVWNGASDPSSSNTIQTGDLWNDSTTDTANILTKTWVNGQWVVIATTLKPTSNPDPDPEPEPDPGPTPTAPLAPTNVVAVAGNAEATVSFDPSEGATSYTVTASTGQTATDTSSPITVTGLTNGTAVTFTVTASNTAGTSQASAVSEGVVPVGVEPQPINPDTRTEGPDKENLSFQGTQGTINYSIAYPSDYFTSQKQYPVIYALHGKTQTNQTFMDNEVLIPIRKVISAGQLDDAVIVTPDSFSTGRWEDTDQGPAETNFLELMPYIESHYNIKGGAAYRLLMGFSMGGHGAFRFGVKYPDKFAAVYSVDGAMSSADTYTPFASGKTSDSFHITTVGGQLCGDRVKAVIDAYSGLGITIPYKYYDIEHWFATFIDNDEADGWPAMKFLKSRLGIAP